MKNRVLLWPWNPNLGHIYRENDYMKRCVHTNNNSSTIHNSQDMCACSVSLVMSDSVTVWIIAHKTPLSMGFSRHEYWSGLPYPLPGDLSNPGIEPRSLTLEADCLPSEPPGKPHSRHRSNQMSINSEWIKKIWYIYTMECYPAIEMK